MDLFGEGDPHFLMVKIESKEYSFPAIGDVPTFFHEFQLMFLHIVEGLLFQLAQYLLVIVGCRFPLFPSDGE